MSFKKTDKKAAMCCVADGAMRLCNCALVRQLKQTSMCGDIKLENWIDFAHRDNKTNPFGGQFMVALLSGYSECK